MARTVVQLEEDEVRCFHRNYVYMWKKLNTAPYYVSGAGQIPPWIHAQWELPSYANLSKCLNAEYVPSMNIVNKIVQFYNANIKPEIDSYIFLHENLEITDNSRITSDFADPGPYCGLYYGYYYAGIPTRKTIYGAMLRIQKVHDTTAVQMISGITQDSDLCGEDLRKLFSAKDITSESYQDYCSGLDLSRRRTFLYKGAAELLPGLLTLNMQSTDRAGSVVVMRLPLTESAGGQYFGSIGLLTLLTEQNLQILKMGVVRADCADLRPFSLQDDQLKQILSIEKLPNEHLQLAFSDNMVWNDLILSNAAET